MKRFFYAVSLLSLSFFSAQCRADTAFIGGYITNGDGSNAITYQSIYEIFTIGNSSCSSITAPPLSIGEINSIALDSSNGAALFGGEFSYEYTPPAIYRMAAGSTTRTSIQTPSGQFGTIASIAITSSGAAILAGTNSTDDSHQIPLVYSLSPGSNTVSSLSLPTGDDEGLIASVLARPDGTAILGGENDTTNFPLVYEWVDGSLVLLDNPNGDDGYLQCGAVSFDGTVLLGGLDDTTGAPLIYRVVGTTIELITPHGGDLGEIKCIAFDSAGNAVLGGSSDSGALLYTLAAGASSVSSITIPDLSDASIDCVAIGPDNAAILGGSIGNATSFIYRLPSGDTTASLIGNSDLAQELYCIAIDSAGTALLGGYSLDNAPILYSVTKNATTASLITIPTNPNLPFGQINCIAIYNSQGLYDFSRLAPIYNQELQQARTKLRSAGL